MAKEKLRADGKSPHPKRAGRKNFQVKNTVAVNKNIMKSAKSGWGDKVFALIKEEEKRQTEVKKEEKSTKKEAESTKKEDENQTKDSKNTVPKEKPKKATEKQTN